MSAPACQTSGELPPTPDQRWGTHERSDDKSRIFRFVAQNPHSDNLPRIVRHLFGADTPMDGKDGALVRRVLQNHPDLFKITAREPRLSVEPTGEALRLFHLTTNKHSAKPQDGEGTEVDTAKRMLAKRSVVTSDRQRGALLQQLVAKRRATEDKFLWFQNRVDDRNLLVPYATRFNSPQRVGESRDKYRTAWERAADRYNAGQVWTLTTDPARFPNLLAAIESLLEDVDRFRAWLSNWCDGRPTNLVVPEFTDAGLPHVHVVLFGVEYLPHEKIRHYWDTHRDRGEIVHYHAIRHRSGRWIWADSGPSSDDPGGPTSRGPRKYLQKTLADAAALAEASPQTVQKAATALRAPPGPATLPAPETTESDETATDTAALENGARWWKLAIYYVTDLPFFTVSPALKASDDEGTNALPWVKRWDFRGVAQFRDLPAHVQREATICRRPGRPPPPGVTP